jgi:hypothetical protein
MEPAMASEIELLRAELKKAQSERALLNTQILQIRMERDSARGELSRMGRLIEAARLKSQLADDLQIEVGLLRQELDREKLKVAAIEESRSWRLILRVRRVVSRFRGRP